MKYLIDTLILWLKTPTNQPTIINDKKPELISVHDYNLNLDFKVHIFWEGHKILRNLHLTFDWHYIGQK